MSIYSTKQVAAKLGLKPDNLSRAIWSGRFSPPEKGPGGNFIWTERDIERASWALLRRAYEPAEEVSDEV